MVEDMEDVLERNRSCSLSWGVVVLLPQDNRRLGSSTGVEIRVRLAGVPRLSKRAQGRARHIR